VKTLVLALIILLVSNLVACAPSVKGSVPNNPIVIEDQTAKPITLYAGATYYITRNYLFKDFDLDPDIFGNNDSSSSATVGQSNEVYVTTHFLVENIKFPQTWALVIHSVKDDKGVADVYYQPAVSFDPNTFTLSERQESIAIYYHRLEFTTALTIPNTAKPGLYEAEVTVISRKTNKPQTMSIYVSVEQPSE
jgi:hypothetical protein